MHDVMTEDFSRARVSPRVARTWPPAWVDAALLVFVALVMFVLSTRHGIGILPDTTRYMRIVDDPFDAPLYTWLLMGGTLSGASLTQAAYAIALFFICANAWLVWWMLFRVTGARSYAAFGTAIILFCPVFVGMHVVAMSEAPFMFSILLTLLALLRYWETERPVWLLWCGVGLGLATLVRFTAPPLGAAIALVLLMVPRHPVTRRLMQVGLVGFTSAAIFLGWAALSQLAEGRSIGRDLAFYGELGPQKLLWSLDSMTSMLLPIQVPLAVRAFVLVVFLLSGIILSISQAPRGLREAAEPMRGARALALTLGLFFVFYMAFLLLAFLLEANQHYTTRYLLPVYVTTVMMMTTLLAEAATVGGAMKWLHHLLVALAMVVLAGHFVRTADRVRNNFNEGVGFASLTWVNSPAVHAVDQLPPGAIIYSNGPDAIAYLTKRRVHMIPHVVYPRMNREDPRNPLAAQLARLDADLAKGNTYIVFLDGVNWRRYLATESFLEKRLQLNLIRQEADGRIYGILSSSLRPKPPVTAE